MIKIISLNSIIRKQYIISYRNNKYQYIELIDPDRSNKVIDAEYLDMNDNEIVDDEIIEAIDEAFNTEENIQKMMQN